MENTTTRRGFVKATAGGAAALAAVAAMRKEAVAEEAAAAPAIKINDQFAGRGNARLITEDIWWVGASDKRLALFENAYPLDHGMAYNSYLIMDESVALIDTVDRSVTGQYLENLADVLGDRKIDYLVVDHMEPDHSAGIDLIISKFPDVTIVTSAKAQVLINQFFERDISDRVQIVAEGDQLVLGKHTLAFVEAPMVHWPEVLMCYDVASGVLFSADAFGSFNALDGNLFTDQVDYANDWLPEARRFLVNIVGKYGAQVQAVLAKAATLDIKYICGTHGLIWRDPDDMGMILDKYSKWSSYTPEDQAVVIYYGSIYGGTENAANILASKISEAGVSNVKVYDVSKTHKSWLIAEAFRASHLVFASATYNMGIFTPMKDFINDLVAHNMQNRHVSFVENGSWQPVAAGLMRDIVAQMPGMTLVGKDVTLMSTTSEANVEELATLAEQIAASVNGAEEEAAALESSGNANAAAGDVMHTQEVVATEGATKKWRCKLCGYKVEADELAEDFVCPLCGAGRDMFEEVVE